LWLTAGLVVAILAGAVAFIALQQAIGTGSGEGIGGGTHVSVVVASSAIEVRSLLTADNIEERQLPVNAVPEGAIQNLEEAIGKITLVELYPGEVLLAQRLVDPNIITGDGRMALVVAEDQVLMTIPAASLMSRLGVLKPGDQVDILFTLNFPVGMELALPSGGDEDAQVVSSTAGGPDRQVTFHLLQNLTIAQIVGEDTPSALMLTVSPQDALVLKHAIDAGGIRDITLRAPGMEEPFDTEPVDIDFMINRYRIPMGIRR
jgi:pilus assembly protein CpaB